MTAPGSLDTLTKSSGVRVMPIESINAPDGDARLYIGTSHFDRTYIS